jgi:hypothetical protein
MTLKDAADLATSLTLIVAAITFIYTIWERNSRERRLEIQDWQKVIVYGLIEEGATIFDDIKLRYVVAFQVSDLKVPKKDIQNESLRLVLISMVESRLVSISDDGRYLVNRVSQPKTCFGKARLR